MTDSHDDPEPIPMRLHCPECHQLHEDTGEFATKPHHTHACQHCGNVWRPAIVPTVGVRFLPGFRDDAVLPVAAALRACREAHASLAHRGYHTQAAVVVIAAQHLGSLVDSMIDDGRSSTP